MQRKAKKSNQKQQSAVQIISAEFDTKTPQTKISENAKKPRAKFACNTNLAEMIRKANLLPADFEFDWKPEEYEKGKYEALERWRRILFFELPRETRTYLLANHTFRPEISDALKYIEKIEGKLPDDTIPALLLSQELLEIKDFLQSLVEMSSMLEFALKNNFVSADTSNILYFLNYLHINSNYLAKHSAVQKFLEIKGAEYKDLPEMIKMGVMIETIAASISNGEREQFNLTTDEAEDFLVSYFYSLKEKFIELSEKESGIFFEQLYAFVENVQTICNKVFATEIIVDGKGNIKFQLSPYAEALQNVNISRLRTCEVCEKFFWAARKDAFTCSKQHAKRRRMRLLRQNWKESGKLYLEARRKKNENKNQAN